MLALALALVLVLEFFPPAVAQEPASPPVTTAALSGVDPGPVVPVGEHGPTVVDVVGAVEAAVTPPATDHGSPARWCDRAARPDRGAAGGDGPGHRHWRLAARPGG